MGDRIFVQNMHGMIHTELRTFISTFIGLCHIYY